ncbi:MAG: hypothetical protein PHD05_00230 [Sphaerochaetaceae bacterium]|jgi:hypothetical protein|nr:hypothetical protein [Sphaerochaetaceae bacterium]
MSLDIEQIKKDGIITALKTKINQLQFYLTNVIWSNYKDQNYFTNLGNIIDDSQETLKNMKEVLNELKKIEPENK